MAIDPSFYESDGNRIKEGAIVNLRFIGDVQSFGKTRVPSAGSTCLIRALPIRLKDIWDGEEANFVSTEGFSGILGMPEYERSIVTGENGHRQLGQPPRPE